MTKWFKKRRRKKQHYSIFAMKKQMAGFAEDILGLQRMSPKILGNPMTLLYDIKANVSKIKAENITLTSENVTVF